LSVSSELPPVKKRGLEFVWLELTSACNLSCIHCYAAEGEPQGPPLNQLQWQGVIAEAASLGCKAVQFTGGEPLLYPELEKLIRFARKMGTQWRLEVFTNGTLLSEYWFSFFAEHGVEVATSLYSSDPATHDKITRVCGSFERTVSAIKGLIRRGLKFRVGIVLMEENKDQAISTIDFLRALGVEPAQIDYDYIRPTGRGKGHICNRALSCACLPQEQKLRSVGRSKRGLSGGQTCWAGKLAVSTNGGVYPCVFARELEVGRISSDGLVGIVAGRPLRSLWDITLDQVTTCSDCEFRYACFDCRAITLSITGDLYAKNPFCTYNPHTGKGEFRGGSMVNVEKPKRRADLLVREVDDELLVYDPKADSVHHLNPMASVIWVMLDGETSVSAIVKEIITVFDTDAGQIRADVTRIVQEMHELGLLES